MAVRWVLRYCGSDYDVGPFMSPSLRPPLTETWTGHELQTTDETASLRIESPYLEVLVLLSGTEESTGAIVEARHSYTLDAP